LSEEDDWAVWHGVKQVLKETGKTLFENVLEEVVNEFECDGYKKAVAKLAFLQSIYFGRKERAS
jgi:hypothetical protein